MVTVFATPKYPAQCARDSCKLTFSVMVERMRMIAYGCFLGMVIVAVISTRLWVVDFLKKGLDDTTIPIEQLGCGPFNRDDRGVVENSTLNRNNEFDLSFGEGFDFDTQNHLLEITGLTNICVYWDYSPAREIVAVVYPFFELTLLMYTTLDWLNTQLSFARGEIPKWYLIFHHCKFGLCMFLFTQFRLIFVLIAYVNVQGHTAAFLCLQIALVLVAIDNFLYVLLTKQTYPRSRLPLKTTKQVRACAAAYLLCNLVVAGFKLYGTAYIVATGNGPPLYLRELKEAEEGEESLRLGKVIDTFWMLFNAVIPFLIATVRAQHEAPMTFEITTPPPIYDGRKDREQAPQRPPASSID
mmetsp:Transcript_17013/g.39073  ORF Transcript_17013/g.39073 Transcript_17013/m.39073 type:complete len:355 (+) Transcript_17013:168-1232(+)|eukprot:CAMPEP_0172389252 /NCGR_PEP_ID=MMETSP1061-20121228/6192_1 /TAXON_ID=37318 /ORGANISM="Pseudo-nitzschia pungens, Strain cf. pungens" /LENGTH=354 /DNA_ID=CAMNT_0013119365 /DNA_START=148 /DNA_END=1212 /DNA_ORIENTATION=+